MGCSQEQPTYGARPECSHGELTKEAKPGSSRGSSIGELARELTHELTLRVHPKAQPGAPYLGSSPGERTRAAHPWISPIAHGEFTHGDHLLTRGAHGGSSPV